MEAQRGTLLLRSDRNEYGPNVLVSNWDQRREAEPKDYDYTKDCRLDTRKSTYKRLGTSEICPRTCYQDLCENLFLKPLYQVRGHDPFHSLHSGTTFKTEYPSVADCGLHKHPPDYNRRYLYTTHRIDYRPPYPYEPRKELFIHDNPSLFKKCLSQFTDVDNHRRFGRNTWHDECGIYANKIIRDQIYEPTLLELRPERCTHVPNHGDQCGQSKLTCKHWRVSKIK